MELRHQTITTTVVTPEDRTLHGLTTLKNPLTDAPTSQLDEQPQAITSLRDAYASWASPNDTPAQILLPGLAQTHQYIRVQKIMMNQPKLQQTINPQKNSRVPNEPARCDPYPRV